MDRLFFKLSLYVSQAKWDRSHDIHMYLKHMSFFKEIHCSFIAIHRITYKLIIKKAVSLRIAGIEI